MFTLYLSSSAVKRLYRILDLLDDTLFLEESCFET